MLVDDLLERVLVGEADDLFDHLAALEEQQGGNPTDVELEGGVRVLVDVQLADQDLAVVVAGQFVDRRRQPAAGAAPFRPEINENGFAPADCLIEVPVRERLYLVGCHRSFALYTF